MRELLQFVLDRMAECYVREYSDEEEEAADIRRLRNQIKVVLNRGFYDGVLTEVDLCRLGEVIR